MGTGVIIIGVLVGFVVFGIILVYVVKNGILFKDNGDPFDVELPEVDYDSSDYDDMNKYNPTHQDFGKYE